MSRVVPISSLQFTQYQSNRFVFAHRLTFPHRRRQFIRCKRLVQPFEHVGVHALFVEEALMPKLFKQGFAGAKKSRCTVSAPRRRAISAIRSSTNKTPACCLSNGTSSRMRRTASSSSPWPKAEDCLQLDVRQLHREGVLRAGHGGNWVWRSKRTGTTTGSLSFRVNAHSLVLQYSAADRPITQEIAVTRTSCNYGGNRPLACMSNLQCAMRSPIFRFGRFACRTCQRVVYRSQSECALGRSWRRQSKAEAQLGPGQSRPKGMHKARYERLRWTIWNCEMLRDDAVEAFEQRLLGGRSKRQ